jgi:uncharacterized protein (DUF1499 family)
VTKANPGLGAHRPVLALAVIAGALLLAAGPGTRAGLWSFSTGFELLRWGAYLGLAAAVVAVVGLIWRPEGIRVGVLVAALIVALGVALVPWKWRRLAKSVPPIHDITTDTRNPPAFVSVLPLRAGAPNSAVYGGPELAAAQQKAYPDVVPLTLPVPPAAAFARALEVAHAMGWELVAADSVSGRIEATATTRWFGFKDDVVVRVAPAPEGSRIDVRSVSRVGRSDVGTNARRIRRYLAKVSETS